MHLRSAALVMAAELVRANLANGRPGSRAAVAAALQRADEALYRAKHEGRNRVVALPLVAADTGEQRLLPLEPAG